MKKKQSSSRVKTNARARHKDRFPGSMLANRIISAVLSVAMVMSSTPMPASAYEASVAPESAVQQEQAAVDQTVPESDAQDAAEPEAKAEEVADEAAASQTDETSAGDAADQEAAEDKQDEALPEEATADVADADEEATDEAVANAEETAEPEANTQPTFIYDDSAVTVTATLSDPASIPAGAKLVVTPVTKESTDYNYDAYMDALNKNAAEGKEYTDDNTLLYDVAFMVPKTDEAGNVIPDEMVEAEPVAGGVTITVEFKQDQLTNQIGASESKAVEIKHLPLADDVRSAVETTAAATDISAADVAVEDPEQQSVSEAAGVQEATFQVDSLSVMAFSAKKAPAATGSDYYAQVNFEGGTPSSLGTFSPSNGTQYPSEYYVQITGTFDGYGNQSFSVPLTIENGVAHAKISGINNNGQMVYLKDDYTYRMKVYQVRQNFGLTRGLDVNVADGNDFFPINTGNYFAGGYTLEYESEFTYSSSSSDPVALTANKVSASPSYNYADALGNSLYFAITAGKFTQKNHMQANIAVKEYKNQGSQADDLNLTGASDGAVIIGKVTSSDNFRIGSSTSGTINVYTSTTDKVSNDSSATINIVPQTEQQLNDTVDSLISHMQTVSNDMARNTTIVPIGQSEKSTYCLDTTNLGPNDTIYVDADTLTQYISKTGALSIEKLDGQTIVFNFDSTSDVYINKFFVNGTGSSTSVSAGDTNNTLDQIARGIIWNITNASNVTINDSTGVFLVNSDVQETQVVGTSSGWLVTPGGAGNPNCEWHGIYQGMKDSRSAPVVLKAAKTVEGKTPTANQTFTFALQEYDATNKTFVDMEGYTATNKGGSVTFPTINFDGSKGRGDGRYIFKIIESNPGVYTASPSAIYAEVTVTHSASANGSVVYSATLPQYYSDFDPEAGTLSGAVASPTFTNSKSAAAEGKATVSGTKRVTGTEVSDLSGFGFTLTQVSAHRHHRRGRLLLLRRDLLHQGRRVLLQGHRDHQQGRLHRHDRRQVRDRQGHRQRRRHPGHRGHRRRRGAHLHQRLRGRGTNAYAAEAAKATLEVTKEYNAWKDGLSFDFTLTAKDDAPMPEAGGNKATATQNAKTATFGEIVFTEAGTYRYVITEDLPEGVTADKPTKDGITYDVAEHQVIVTVTDDGEGQLVVSSIDYDGKSGLTVTNTYTEEHHGNKEEKKGALAQTGDPMMPMEASALLATCGAVAVYAGARRKKREER